MSGDPATIMERMQAREAEQIARALLRFTPYARQARLDAMSADWRNEVEEAMERLQKRDAHATV